MHKHRHHSQRKDHNNSKRTQMHKMATPNPQKTHNTPPSHNNDTTKKDHRRPSQQLHSTDSLQKCTNIDTIHKERIITTANAHKCTKWQHQILKKHTIPPPHTIMTPQKKTIVALVNSSFNRIPYRNAQTSTPFTKKGS